MLVALEGLKPAWACADAQIGRRVRTDLAVMNACGSQAVQVDGSQEPFVLPAGRAHVRRRLEAPLLAERLAMQAAPAMADALVRPAHLVVDIWPRAQGSPRVQDAATLSKAPKQCVSSVETGTHVPPSAAFEMPSSHSLQGLNK